MNQKPFISVIIKTYNEQSGIAGTINSIREQLDFLHMQYEVIVADSLSDDKTREIAMRHQAKVVTLKEGKDRCCGVGHQLGYLYARGEFLLLMDGDMALQPGFIERGVRFLLRNPDYAGVAGTVTMDEAVSYEFQSRQQRLHKIYPLGDCSHLGGGGLYRRSAIEQIGYLTHSGLHAYEEAELGMRLKHAGYRLRRLNTPYFFHQSYDMPTFALLRHRWRGGYAFASGELLKSAWKKPYFTDAVLAVKNEAVFSLYLSGLCLLLLSGNLRFIGYGLLPVIAFFLLKAMKNRSAKAAALSVINLTVFSAGLIRGLLSPLKAPDVTPVHEVLEVSE
ncbi:Putative glycosyltransferase EpsH [Vibrio aerogenes CECT 7868]|uniref:Putative glycosyltransferase EpsH n=1 Tax=Vibrio aerogenes CECT 7868 TaxID=1216006 RepID=A0A1M5VSM2_9VIBR|nr:glycosyltransferase [Vibrio aerogenes]SHH78256.1 Putative glycosyltransferase EpsH [Vibrio aerogenes CECT 7868]